MIEHPLGEIPRGIRNNNPGNVRIYPGIVWQGQSGSDADGFLMFTDSLFGIRCIAVILRHYQRYNRCRTVWDYIRRWAPPSENDTISYVDYVAESIGGDSTSIVRLDADLPLMIRAIIVQENGYCPYDDDAISRGIYLSSKQ